MLLEAPTSIGGGRFTIYLIKLAQANANIEIDVSSLEDDVEPEAEPEASFS